MRRIFGGGVSRAFRGLPPPPGGPCACEHRRIDGLFCSEHINQAVVCRNRPESGRTRTLLTRAGGRNHASHHCTPVRPPRFTNPCSLAGSLLSVGPLGGPRAPTVPAAGTTHGRRASAPCISRAPPPPPRSAMIASGGLALPALSASHHASPRSLLLLVGYAATQRRS